MLNFIRNLSFLIVVAFIIAANPGVLTSAVQLCTRVVYNGSVAVVTVVGEAVKKARETDKEDLFKEVPKEAPKKVKVIIKKGKQEASEYSSWMEKELQKLSRSSSRKTTPVSR